MSPEPANKWSSSASRYLVNAPIEVFSLENISEQELHVDVDMNPDRNRVPSGKTIKKFSPVKVIDCHALVGPSGPNIFANVPLFIEVAGGDWDDLCAEVDGKRLKSWV